MKCSITPGQALLRHRIMVELHEMTIKLGSAEPGYTLLYKNSVDPDQVASKMLTASATVIQ